MIKHISSKQNQIIKDAVKLADSKFALSKGVFKVEGFHNLEMALASGVVQQVFTTKVIESLPVKIDQVVVTEEILEKLASTKNPQGVIAICSLLEQRNAFGDKILYLDGVSDPGNMGTLLRTALAFGYNDIILGEGCVSQYNEKVLQATQGAIFELNIVNNFDLSKITTACETDCSALVAVCVNAAGISVSKDLYTGSEEQLLKETGKFTTYTSSQYVGGSDYLKRGDILLGSGHTAVVLSNGPKASASAPAAQPAQPSVGSVIGTAVAKTSMHVRSGDSTSYASLGIISTNTTVEVLEVLSSGWYKIVWPKASCGYAYTSNSNNQYYTYTAKSVETTTNYLVKINTDALNIRKGPGTSYAIAGCIRDRGTYTIVKQNGNWGYLKSGAGWICLDYTIRR